MPNPVGMMWGQWEQRGMRPCHPVSMQGAGGSHGASGVWGIPWTSGWGHTCAARSVFRAPLALLCCFKSCLGENVAYSLPPLDQDSAELSAQFWVLALLPLAVPFWGLNPDQCSFLRPGLGCCRTLEEVEKGAGEQWVAVSWCCRASEPITRYHMAPRDMEGHQGTWRGTKGHQGAPRDTTVRAQCLRLLFLQRMESISPLRTSSFRRFQCPFFKQIPHPASFHPTSLHPVLHLSIRHPSFLHPSTSHPSTQHPSIQAVPTHRTQQGLGHHPALIQAQQWHRRGTRPFYLFWHHDPNQRTPWAQCAAI